MVQFQILQRPVFVFIFIYFLAAKSSKNCRRLVAIGPSYKVPEQVKAMADGDCIHRRPTSRCYAGFYKATILLTIHIIETINSLVSLNLFIANRWIKSDASLLVWVPTVEY
jgi:hypothetical protein